MDKTHTVLSQCERPQTADLIKAVDHDGTKAVDRAILAATVLESPPERLLRHATLAAVLERQPIVRLRTASLAPGDSPRRTGEDPGHTRMLAGSHDRMPPIVVHRSTMQVIDGMHRLRAAQLRGEPEIEAKFFEGDTASAFVVAVHANVRHGLPLSLADRKAAADRIIELYPAWSDRAIAEVVGLSASTVGARRRRLRVQIGQLDAKIGRDGRVRPVDIGERRAAAERLIADKPTLSLREVARQARLSPETVRRLRAGISSANHANPLQTSTQPSARARGLEAPPLRQSDACPGARAEGSPTRALAADPAFRSTDGGRAVLRLLCAAEALDNLGSELIEAAPAHSVDWLVLAVQACISQWQAFAVRLERRRVRIIQR